jgi:hypothetical protein
MIYRPKTENQAPVIESGDIVRISQANAYHNGQFAKVLEAGVGKNLQYCWVRFPGGVIGRFSLTSLVLVEKAKGESQS